MSKRGNQRTRSERQKLERREERLTAPVVEALDMVAETVERKVGKDESRQPRFTTPTSIFSSVFRWAIAGTLSEPGGYATTRQWDAWYREFSKREPFLVSVLNAATQIDRNRGWTLTGGQRQVNKYTDVLHALEAGQGWRTHIDWQAQSYYTTRMGFVAEVGREGRGGPLATLWSVDPARCEMSGNPETPLRYYPRIGGMQEWLPDYFIRGKSLVSTDEAQLDNGYPAVARCYDLAKIMLGVYSHYQQKLGTKTPDGILTGKFIGEEQWDEAVRARAESLMADPSGYLNSIATIMSSGGDMPEFALTLLSSMPDGWDVDTWTKLLMRGYELAFGYQGEFYPESAGVLGRGNEVQIQHRNATAQGGKDFSLTYQEQLQSVLPPTLEFEFEERDVGGETEEASLQLAKAQVITEMTKWVVNGQSVLTVPQIMTLAAEQGVVPDEWTPQDEDVTATDEEDAGEEGAVAPALLTSERVQRAMRAFQNEPIVRHSWPSGKTRILRAATRRTFYFPKGIRRSVNEVVTNYRDRLTRWVYEAMTGKMDVTDLRRAHKALIRSTARDAYFEGMREGGVASPADDATDKDAAAIKEWVTAQVGHVDGFAQAAVDVFNDESKRPAVLSRVDLWADSVSGLGNTGLLSAKSDRPAVWHLGPTETHCSECAALDGKRHRVSWFLNKGYLPHTPPNAQLGCDGWGECFISDAVTGERIGV